MKQIETKDSLFDQYAMEDMETTDNVISLEQISFKRIKKMTMKKIREERKTAIPFTKRIMRASIAACFVIRICSATVYAAAGGLVKETIGDLLGISQAQILKVGESITGKDYMLTVNEFACDSYTGIVTVSVQALSPEAKEGFLNENIVRKFGHLGSVGYGIGELDNLRDSETRYFSFSFNVGDARHRKDGLSFSMEGIDKEIQIPITQTIELTELDIDIPAGPIYPAAFQKLYYSELGFTLLGDVADETYENIDIDIVFEDGSISHFYHSYSGNTKANLSGSAAGTQISNNGKETSVANTAAAADKNDNSKLVFDEEWFSGGSVSTSKGNQTFIFSFLKKMDWSTVKSIGINGTTVDILPGHQNLWP